MCGRFALTETNPTVLAQVFDLDSVPSLSPRYNIAPTQAVATVVRDPENGRSRLEVMRWGLIPSWAKDPAIGNKMINARGETIAEKPAFRAALRYRRCLVIADGFYEWAALDTGPKQPLFITIKDRRPFGMAGLWERWTEPSSGEVLTTCTIITTEPNELMATIHNRMPVILPRDAYADWLDPKQTDGKQLLPLIQSYPADRMTAWPVSRRVNSPQSDDPSLVERVGG
ncbi:MAG: SOS response-associated peptidase [Chloroflexi bacterium]|nr:SOS response-associated peptidase [Chloroflexota bacterium]